MKERLFVLCGLMAGVSAVADAREVTLRGSGVWADVAVSVTDDKLADAEKDYTIQTSLLLEGDLRGSVEDAGWYFPDSVGRVQRLAMDALMLTQGWSRYDIPEVIATNYSEPTSDLEIGPSVAGKVKSRWKGKPLENASVLLFAPSLVYMEQSYTDENGDFCFTDKDFPEGTELILQVFNEKGKNESNFDVSEEKYPDLSPLSSHYNVSTPSDVDNEQTDYDFRISNSGERMLSLGEVTVTASRIKDNEDVISQFVSAEIDYEMFEKNGITTYEEALARIPGLIFKDGQPSFRNYPVEIWIDGTLFYSAPKSGDTLTTGNKVDKVDKRDKRDQDGIIEYGFNVDDFSLFNTQRSLSHDDLTKSSGIIDINNGLNELKNVLPFSSVKEIRHFRPNVSVLFSMKAAHEGGVLMITTKTGDEKIKEFNWQFRAVTPLGYQRRKEFYAPKYELMADYEPNNRPTLYWIPRATLDRYGNLSLPLPKSIKSYTVTAEGIDAEGHPVRVSKKI